MTCGWHWVDQASWVWLVYSQGRHVGLLDACSTVDLMLANWLPHLCLVWRALLRVLLNWLVALLLLLLPVLLKPCQHSIDQSITILQDAGRFKRQA